MNQAEDLLVILKRSSIQTGYNKTKEAHQSNMTPLTTKNNNCTKWLDRDINTAQTTYTSEAVYILMEVPRGQEVPLIIIRETSTPECTVVTSTGNQYRIY
jgi:hypothetical protein